jgi:hypothetical protein
LIPGFREPLGMKIGLKFTKDHNFSYEITADFKNRKIKRVKFILFQ